MDISQLTMDSLFTGFMASFQSGLAGVTPTWNRIASEVPSISERNTYTWLGDIPGLREWIGSRQVKQLDARDYTVANRLFEQTITVKGTKIQDDQYGMYGPLFTGMGQAVARWPDEVVWAAARNGFTANCYDGQFFFDNDHPAYNANGEQSGTASNVQAGTGSPWMLLNTKGLLKPFIWQTREKPDKVVRLDRSEDSNVFMYDTLLYGARGRGAAAYGFWQMAFGSKATLNAANFTAARTVMTSLFDGRGRPIENEPDLLVVGPANRGAAEDMLNKAQLSNGESNILYKAIDLLITPHLY